jgi:hypothetical protein
VLYQVGPGGAVARAVRGRSERATAAAREVRQVGEIFRTKSQQRRGIFPEPGGPVQLTLTPEAVRFFQVQCAPHTGRPARRDSLPPPSDFGSIGRH